MPSLWACPQKLLDIEMINVISVIICTYNPNADRLNKTLNGLRLQGFPLQNWELIIVDNDSKTPIIVDLKWHPSARIVKEPKPGLTRARIKGFTEAKGEIILMVDDDNVLDQNYLQNCSDIFDKYPKLGAIGGNILPDFETIPPEWTKQFWGSLALRTLEKKIQLTDFSGIKITHYPSFAPVGAGMAIRNIALEKYMANMANGENVIQDRSGNKLTSSGDNEIVMQIMLNGFEAGFFPQLQLNHLIPPDRFTKNYLGKLNQGIMSSWTAFLIKYQICPWKRFPKYLLWPRLIKAYLKYKPWQNEKNLVTYKGIKGQLQALAEN